jgi:GR25 family glycosyltransferase involved in LPS biosynthesis
MENNYIIFNQSGRFGNAVFRYMAYIMLQKNNNNNNKFKYILDTDFSKLDIPEYTFFNGVDYLNNDISSGFYDSIDEVNEKCSKISDGEGYNTLGYIKSDIDISNLTATPYINQETGGGIYVKNTILINEYNFFKYINTATDTATDYNTSITKLPNNRNISLRGYFQYDQIYLQNKSYILEFLEEHKNIHEIRTDDETYLTKHIIDDMLLDSSKIYENVIHIRLGDFNGRPDFIESEYLLRLFDNIKDIFYNKTAIVIETPTSEADIIYLNTILDWFKKNNIPVPVIESNDMLTDYNIMKQAKIIVSSMSTLCWAAAYFSKSLEKIYMPNYNFFDIEDRKNGYFKTPIKNTILYDVKTTKFTDIKVVILTLEKYSHRMNKMYDLINKLSQIGLQCTLFYGVNGEDIKITKNKKSTIYNLEYNNETKYYDYSVRVNKLFMTRGELGCAWSHMNIYKSLSKEEHVGKYLIFEDDVEMVESLEYAYNCLVNIPNELDVCHIAKSDWDPFILNSKVNEMWYTINKLYFNRLTAYIVSKNGAQKILDWIEDYIVMPADDLLSNMHLRENLGIYVPSTYIFHEPQNTVSIIKNFVGKY